jgi:hypothetical protein
MRAPSLHVPQFPQGLSQRFTKIPQQHLAAALDGFAVSQQGIELLLLNTA